MTWAATIDAAAVERIAGIDDPALRNVWITYAYAELNRRVRAAAGLDRDHCWCGFATWASATAGRTIRRQDLPALLVDILDASQRHRDGLAKVNAELQPAAVATPPIETDDLLAACADALDVASDHVAHGNLVVFAELAPLFVAFAELLERDGREVDQGAISAALGNAARTPLDSDLIAAFQWYGYALGAGDSAERARAMLAANVLAVSHEQRRLQDDIAAALNSGLRTIESIIEELSRRARENGGVTASGDTAGRSLRELVIHAWDVIMTTTMMTLCVPGAVLRLADDVPPGPDGQLFPADLAQLAGPPVATPDAAGVFGGWDRTDGTGKHDGARDWASLAERMSYIANLFRSRQQDQTLADAPFDDAQLAAMSSGVMPPPPLLPPHHRRTL